MHLAVQSAFPNLSVSAEREFIARIHLAGQRLGWRISDVVTSDDIISCDPDMVLATHEFTPKLTQYPTCGVIWSPLEYFAGDPLRIQNILSYDGCLVATPALREWTQELFDRHGKLGPVSSFDFLPTALSASVVPPIHQPKLFYAGVHWDGARHGDLFSELEGRCPMRIFGKAEKWSGHKDYAGELPFNGTAVVDAIAQCGVALAIHTDAHRRGDTPSMRIFEAAAAGAVIIADRIPFALRHFGDSALWIDVDKPAPQVASQILQHMDWVRDNFNEATEMAQRANAIFREKFELTNQISQLKGFLKKVHNNHNTTPICNDNISPVVDVIMRVGSRPVDQIQRAVKSLADQTYPHISLVLVKFRDVAGLETLLAEYEKRFVHIRIVNAPDNGLRSTALWAGLRAIEGDFLSNLDDDDALHPNHIEGLVRGLLAAPAEVPLVYSGTIEVQEEDGHWFDQPNFRGDLSETIPERRRLRFMDVFSRERMYAFDNFVNSNAWMMRRSALDFEVLDDPKVRVAEDIYLYLMVMRQGPFQLVPEATALWFWRSSSKDNSMFSHDCWATDGPLIAERLRRYGALPDNISPRAPQKQALTPRQFLRRPSLLLGPLAPKWRKLRNKLFRKSKRIKDR